MNTKGQFGIVTIVGIMIVLLALAPILLSIVQSTVGGFSKGVNASSPDASAKVDQVQNTFTTLWDYVILFIFLFNVLLLLVSSFFIDTHPVFVVLYIVVCFFLFIFSPYLVDSVEKIWDTPYYVVNGVANNLTMTQFFLDNFTGILLMLYIISGLIIYGKIKFFGNSYS